MLRPTLIIALGGTGTEVALKLRQRFMMEFGTSDPEGVEFIFIDTDGNNNRARQLFPEKFVQLTVSQSRLFECQDTKSQTYGALQLDDWFDPEMRDRLTNQNFGQGVGGVRMYGRLALLASSTFGNMSSMIQKQMQALHGPSEKLHVFVVASAGGGTGSGTFIDMGYITRLQRKLLSLNVTACSCEGYLAIAVPTLVSTPNQKRNSAAVLDELDFFSKERNIFTSVYGNIPLSEDIGREAPYDSMFLISPTQGSLTLDAKNPVSAMRKLEQKIADTIFVRMLGPAELEKVDLGIPQTGEIDARICDMSQNWQQFPEDNNGYPNRFLSFGVGLLHFPVGLCEALGRCRAISRFTDQWLKVGELDAISPEELARDPLLRNFYSNDLANLRKWLGLPEVQGQGETVQRDADKDQLFHELLRVKPGELAPEMALQARSREGKHRIDDLFDYREGVNQPIQPSSPGYIAGVVFGNLAVMMDPNDRSSSLFNGVKSLILEAAFDGARGPRYTLGLIRDIVNEIGHETGVINSMLSSGSVSVSEESGHGAAKRIKQDKLLLFWRETVARRAMNAGNQDMATYANWRFEVCLIEAKKRVYETLLNQLFSDGFHLESRVKQLISYIIGWKNDKVKERIGLEQLVENLPSGTVWPEQAIERKWLALTPELDPDMLEDLKSVVAETGFWRQLPTVIGGLTDYSPFALVEKAIDDSLSATEDVSPEDSIRGESVIRLRAEEKQGDLSADAQDIVNGSRPLLNMDLAAPGYAEQIAHFPHNTYLWYFIAEPGINIPTYNVMSEQVQLAREAINLSIFQGHGENTTLASARGSICATMCIRGAFPTRIINQYDPNSRRNIIHPPSVNNLVTAYTRSRIIPPIPETEMRKTRVKLLLAEVLLVRKPDSVDKPRIVRDSPETHLFIYDTYRDNTVLETRLRMSKTNLESAVVELLNRPGALDALSRVFNAISTDSNQKGSVAEKITKQVQDLNELVNKGQTEGYFPGLDYNGLDFLEARTLILEGARELGLDLSGRVHPWARFDEDDQVWKCVSCGYNHGTDVPDINGSCVNTECGFPKR